ncbi:hypothetical protein M378DRAFT_182731, partial [Amanita muscaria Koide BX008]
MDISLRELPDSHSNLFLDFLDNCIAKNTVALNEPIANYENDDINDEENDDDPGLELSVHHDDTPWGGDSERYDEQQIIYDKEYESDDQDECSEHFNLLGLQSDDSMDADQVGDDEEDDDGDDGDSDSDGD